MGRNKLGEPRGTCPERDTSSYQPSRRARDARPPCLEPKVDAGGRYVGQRPRPSIGDRFGELTVIGYRLGSRGGLRAVLVQCSCGRPPHEVFDYNLHKGASTRCKVCARAQAVATRKNWWRYADVCADDNHRRRLLNRIAAIVQRCENPKSKQYANYGGRGIRVHPAWLGDRASFLRYLLTIDGWDNAALDLDRTDNERGYEPGNVRFVTRKVNQDNRRTIAALQAEVDTLRARIRHCTCGAAQSIHDHDNKRAASRS